jgi:hypothetical protein
VQLERISLALRPRHGHECIDLAAAMLRSWGGAVFAAWGVTVLPVCLLLLFALDSVWLSLFLMWLLRPLFELVPMFVASRATFGAAPTLQASLAVLPGALLRQLAACVLRYRWVPWRALVQPVPLLEGEVGDARRRRERSLRVAGAGDAVLAACFFLALELALFLQGLLLLWFFTPGELAPDLSPLEDGNFAGVHLGWFAIAMKLLWLACYSLCGTLHSLSGFALYLNERSRIEGWDIELSFRRLGARAAKLLRQGAATAVLLSSLLVPPGLAQEPVEPTTHAASEASEAETEQASAEPLDPASVAREVLAHEDFDTTEARTRFKFRWNGSPDASGALDLGIVAYVLQFLGWTLLVALIVGVVVLILRKAGLVEWRTPAQPKLALPPTHVFGLDVRPESLPEDIGARARELWLSGDATGAMGLLYRGALSRLIAAGALAPDPGDTERDCVERVRGLGRAELASFFAAVTRAWLVCAYSRTRPDDASALSLCDAWAIHFERRPA